MSSLTSSIVEVVVRFKRDHVSYLYLSYVFMLYKNGKMCFRPSLLKSVKLIVNSIERDHRKDLIYEEEQIKNVFFLISIVTQSI